MAGAVAVAASLTAEDVAAIEVAVPKPVGERYGDMSTTYQTRL